MKPGASVLLRRPSRPSCPFVAPLLLFLCSVPVSLKMGT